MRVRSWVTLCPALLVLPQLVACSQVAGLQEREPYPADAGDESLHPDVVDPVPAAQPETCNQLDDDGDGVVDEGFDWTPGPWVKVLEGNALEGVRVAPLSGERIAILVADRTADGDRSLHVAIVAKDGTVLGGPSQAAVAPAFDGFGLAAAPEQELGVAYVADDAGCELGCRVDLVRFNANSLSEIERRTIDTEDIPDAPNSPAMRLFDIGWSTTGYVLHIQRADGSGRLVFVNSLWVSYGWTGIIAGMTPSAGWLSVGPEIGWVQSGLGESGYQQVSCGIASLGGYREYLYPTPVTSTWAPALSDGGRGLAWLGSDLVAGFTITYGESRPTIVRIAPSGTLYPTPELSQARGYQARSVLNHHDNIVLTATKDQQVRMLRLSGDLLVVSSPSGVLDIADVSSHAVASVDSGVSFVRVSEDRHAVHASLIGCAP